MGLFDVFRSKKSKKAQAAAAMTPLEIAREVERLIEADDLREALNVAERGVYDHPRSEVVNAAYRFLRRTTLGEDVVELRREMDTRPSAVVYANLAEAYKEVGDFDKALETCHRAIELYPDHEGAWIILAEIRLERFREDWIPKDGELCVEFLERAYDLNRNSKRTLIQLAELYTEFGLKRRAIRKCEAILYFAPDDERALQVLRKAQALNAGKREELTDRIARYAEKKRRAVQRRSQRPGDALGPSGRLVAEPASLQTKLDHFQDFVSSYETVLGLKLDGTLLASSDRTGADIEAVRSALHDLFEASNRCSLLMDIGHFKRGVFRCKGGYVYLVEFDQLRVVTLCARKTPLDRLEEAMARFVEDELYR